MVREGDGVGTTARTDLQEGTVDQEVSPNTKRQTRDGISIDTAHIHDSMSCVTAVLDPISLTANGFWL